MDGTTCNVKRSDLRLYISAIRREWPFSETERAKMKAAAMEAMLCGNDRMKSAGEALLRALDSQATTVPIPAEIRETKHE